MNPKLYQSSDHKKLHTPHCGVLFLHSSATPSFIFKSIAPLQERTVSLRKFASDTIELVSGIRSLRLRQLRVCCYCCFCNVFSWDIMWNALSDARVSP